MNQCTHLIHRAGQQRRCVLPAGHPMLHRSQGDVLRLPVNPVSGRRRREWREYRVLRRDFLTAHARCEWPAGCTQPATQVHHKRGRVGADFLDTARWLPLCSDHHAWITEHPAEAVEMGVSELRIGRAS